MRTRELFVEYTRATIDDNKIPYCGIPDFDKLELFLRKNGINKKVTEIKSSIMSNTFIQFIDETETIEEELENNTETVEEESENNTETVEEESENNTETVEEESENNTEIAVEEETEIVVEEEIEFEILDDE